MFFFCFGFRYNPYVQTRGRIDQLKRLGHSVDKVWSSIIVYSVIEVRSIYMCVNVVTV